MVDGVVEKIVNYSYGTEGKIFVSDVNDATDIKTRRRVARLEDDVIILLCNYIKKCE